MQDRTRQSFKQFKILNNYQVRGPNFSFLLLENGNEMIETSVEILV